MRSAPFDARPLTSSATVPWPIEKTWKPPESVMIGASQRMKRCRPPWLGDQLVAGLQVQVEGVAEHHVVAERGHLGGVRPRTVAFVASGTNAGVRTLPCAVVSTPARAREPGSRATISKGAGHRRRDHSTAAAPGRPARRGGARAQRLPRNVMTK